MGKRRRPGVQGATIRDVAARAQVSPMTVSRVINNHALVSDSTRAMVLAAMDELNYSPNSAARSLAARNYLRIGLLYSNPSRSFLSEFLLGVLAESSKTGDQLMVEKCAANTASELSALRKMISGGVQGVILPPPLCEAREVLKEIRETGIPAVAIGPGCQSDDVATVRMDNYKAAYEMTSFLLSLGHRRISFIKGHPNQTVSNQRLQGFLDALAAGGIEPSTASLEQGYYSYQSGLVAAEKLLRLMPRPTAIFAANDDMAAAALAMAHKFRIDVPSQLSVAGFDDALIAATLWPALTTVHQPIAAMARAGVQLLLTEVSRHRTLSDDPPAQLLLRHTLIRRESTAIPPTD